MADSVKTPVYLYDIPARTQNHIEPETAQTLAKHGNIAGIKDSGGKVQAQIQGEQLRVTGKKRDDLQAAIALLRAGELEMPLQFENFRD